VGGWRWAVGGWRLAVGGWRLAVGGGQWAVGVWRLAVGVIVLVLESRASLYKAGRPRRRRRAAIGDVMGIARLLLFGSLAIPMTSPARSFGMPPSEFINSRGFTQRDILLNAAV
jgi:hypothetical protein